MKSPSLLILRSLSLKRNLFSFLISLQKGFGSMLKRKGFPEIATSSRPSGQETQEQNIHSLTRYRSLIDRDLGVFLLPRYSLKVIKFFEVPLGSKRTYTHRVRLLLRRNETKTDTPLGPLMEYVCSSRRTGLS